MGFAAAKPILQAVQTGAIVLLIVLFFLFSAPVIHLFNARAFSFAISMAFPAVGARPRPVDRLYFSKLFFTSARTSPVAELRTAVSNHAGCPVFFIASIVLGIAFPLIPIVPAPAYFLSPTQSLAL